MRWVPTSYRWFPSSSMASSDVLGKTCRWILEIRQLFFIAAFFLSFFPIGFIRSLFYFFSDFFSSWIYSKSSCHRHTVDVLVDVYKILVGGFRCYQIDTTMQLPFGVLCAGGPCLYARFGGAVNLSSGLVFLRTVRKLSKRATPDRGIPSRPQFDLIKRMRSSICA